MAKITEALKTSQSSRQKELQSFAQSVTNDLRQTGRGLESEISTLRKNVVSSIANQRRLNLVIPILLTLAILFGGMVLGRFLTHEYEINTFQKCLQVVKDQSNPKQLYCQIKPQKHK
uniref:Uncharacterized protein n=1 Tax=Vibrio alginolyticus TaxID=663 RepID=C8CE66_VIBAL|nr:hypothetical protein pVAE259_00030 [Vibrio alginolyticus]